jgi:hypothetical protein
LDKVIRLRNEFSGLCIVEVDNVVEIMGMAMEGHCTDEDSVPDRDTTDDGLEKRSEDNKGDE